MGEKRIKRQKRGKKILKLVRKRIETGRKGEKRQRGRDKEGEVESER